MNLKLYTYKQHKQNCSEKKFKKLEKCNFWLELTFSVSHVGAWLDVYWTERKQKNFHIKKYTSLLGISCLHVGEQPLTALTSIFHRLCWPPADASYFSHPGILIIKNNRTESARLFATHHVPGLPVTSMGIIS